MSDDKRLARELSRKTTLTATEARRYLRMGYTLRHVQLMHDHARVNNITMQQVVEWHEETERRLLEGDGSGEPIGILNAQCRVAPNA